MKNFILLFGTVNMLILLCLAGACKKQDSASEKKRIPTSVTDIDGNIYKVKRFENKLWMVENLRVTHYDTESLCKKDTIFEATESQGVDVQRPYFKDARYFKESPDTDNLTDDIRNSLGFLYNWCAASGITGSSTSVTEFVQGICPNGWRLPNSTDFEELCNYLGEKETAGKKLKSVKGWLANNGTDESDMNCYPAGLAIRNNVSFMGKQTIFWSSKNHQMNSTKAEVLKLFYEQDHAEILGVDKTQANSVRCILDLDASYIGF